MQNETLPPHVTAFLDEVRRENEKLKYRGVSPAVRPYIALAEVAQELKEQNEQRAKSHT